MLINAEPYHTVSLQYVNACVPVYYKTTQMITLLSLTGNFPYLKQPRPAESFTTDIAFVI